MVRPVEPDPPQQVTRHPGGVRGATATPEQLGQTPVQDQGDRPGRKKSKPSAHAPEGDTVSLEQGANQAPGAREPDGPKTPGGKDRDPREHLDVTG